MQVARCLPWVVNNYKLEEITSVQELRRNVAKLFKLNSNLRNPGVRCVHRAATVFVLDVVAVGALSSAS